MKGSKIISLIFFLMFIFALNAQIEIVWIIAEPDTIYFDDNETYSEVSVKVVDDDNDPISGLTVHYNCDLGSILSFDTTNDEGIATSTFWESGDLGTATITATVGDIWEQVTVVILPVVSADDDLVPLLELSAHPNPFNPVGRNQVTIAYSTSSQQPVDIRIFDIKGRIVHTFTQSNPMINYTNKYYWNGKDNNGKSARSGIYLYQVNQAGISNTGKITLVR